MRVSRDEDVEERAIDARPGRYAAPRVVRRHVFGRAPDGYTTLVQSPGLSLDVCRSLECFEFGESVVWLPAADPADERHLRFVLRPIADLIALTRVEPGPPDPSRQATLTFRTLLFEASDAAWLVTHLRELLRDTAAFAFRGDEVHPIVVAPAPPAAEPPRPELVDCVAAAPQRNATIVVPRTHTSLDEIAGVVAAIHAGEGEIPFVVVGPGSDSLDCDLRVVDPACRRGNPRRDQIAFGEQSEAWAWSQPSTRASGSSASRAGRAGDNDRGTMNNPAFEFEDVYRKGSHSTATSNERTVRALLVGLLVVLLVGLTATAMMVRSLAGEVATMRSKLAESAAKGSEDVGILASSVKKLHEDQDSVDQRLAGVVEYDKATRDALDRRFDALEAVLGRMEASLGASARGLELQASLLDALPRALDARVARVEVGTAAALDRQRVAYFLTAVVNRIASGIEGVLEAAATADAEIDRGSPGKSGGKTGAPAAPKASDKKQTPEKQTPEKKTPEKTR